MRRKDNELEIGFLLHGDYAQPVMLVDGAIAIAGNDLLPPEIDQAALRDELALTELAQELLDEMDATWAVERALFCTRCLHGAQPKLATCAEMQEWSRTWHDRHAGGR